MGEKKTYKSVGEMFANYATPEDSKAFNKMITSRKLSKLLFSMRCKAGLTQAELAQKSGMTQSKISKIEHSSDRDLSMGDILDFCSALNFTVNVGVMPSKMSLPSMVKYHWFEIQRLLNRICQLSDGDEVMEKEAKAFTFEAAFNISNGLMACLDKFVPKQEEGEPLNVLAPSEYRLAPCECQE